MVPAYADRDHCGRSRLVWCCCTCGHFSPIRPSQPITSSTNVTSTRVALLIAGVRKPVIYEVLPRGVIMNTAFCIFHSSSLTSFDPVKQCTKHGGKPCEESYLCSTCGAVPQNNKHIGRGLDAIVSKERLCSGLGIEILNRHQGWRSRTRQD